MTGCPRLEAQSYVECCRGELVVGKGPLVPHTLLQRVALFSGQEMLYTPSCLFKNAWSTLRGPDARVRYHLSSDWASGLKKGQRGVD